MREIKFNVWDTHLRVMHQDRHLFHEFITELADDRYRKLQYTGIIDNNGVQLYNGDIVKYAFDWDYSDSECKNRVFKKETPKRNKPDFGVIT